MTGRVTELKETGKRSSILWFKALMTVLVGGAPGKNQELVTLSVSPVGGRDISTCAIFHCLRRHINRKLDY